MSWGARVLWKIQCYTNSWVSMTTMPTCPLSKAGLKVSRCGTHFWLIHVPPVSCRHWCRPPSAWSPVTHLCDQGPTHTSDGVLEGCVWQSSVPHPLLRCHLQQTCRLPFFPCTCSLVGKYSHRPGYLTHHGACEFWEMPSPPTASTHKLAEGPL